MPKVYPKKEDMDVFKDLSKYLRSFKDPCNGYAIHFKKTYKDLIKNEFIEFTTTRYRDRKDKMIFALGENVTIKEIKKGSRIGYKIDKFHKKFNKIKL